MRIPSSILCLAFLATSPAVSFLLPPPPCISSSSLPTVTTTITTCSRFSSTSSSKRPRCSLLLAVTTTAAASTATEEAENPSLAQGVFIEHTDRYGMVYHSNYLLFLCRALYLTLGRHVVTRLDNFRFKASARLGHDIAIDVRHKAGKDNTFSTSIKESEAPHTTFITADVTAFSLSDGGKEGGREDWSAHVIPEEEALREVVASPDKVMEAVLWTDELGVHDLLTPHAALSLFERGRSESLGGPDRLEELMDDGYMFVVARIDGYRFNPSLRLKEGDVLQVLGRFKPKSDAIVVCQQVLVVKATQQIVAQALVTLACIGAVDGKLRAVPSKALESMNMGMT